VRWGVSQVPARVLAARVSGGESGAWSG